MPSGRSQWIPRWQATAGWSGASGAANSDHHGQALPTGHGQALPTGHQPLPTGAPPPPVLANFPTAVEFMVGEMRKWEARAAEARSVEAEARAYAEDAELQAHRWHCDAWEAHVRNNSRLKRERWTARLCARTLCIICQYYTDIYQICDP